MTTPKIRYVDPDSYMNLDPLFRLARIRQEVVRPEATDRSLSLAVSRIPEALSIMRTEEPDSFTLPRTRTVFSGLLGDAFNHSIRKPKLVKTTLGLLTNKEHLGEYDHEIVKMSVLVPLMEEMRLARIDQDRHGATIDPEVIENFASFVVIFSKTLSLRDMTTLVDFTLNFKLNSLQWISLMDTYLRLEPHDENLRSLIPVLIESWNPSLCSFDLFEKYVSILSISSEPPLWLKEVDKLISSPHATPAALQNMAMHASYFFNTKSRFDKPRRMEAYRILKDIRRRLEGLGSTQETLQVIRWIVEFVRAENHKSRGQERA